MLRLGRLCAVALLLAGACASQTPCPPPRAPAQAVEAAPPSAEVQPAEPAAAEERATAASGPLHVEGVPEVPEELSARIRQYLETRHASMASLAPDGRSMLVRTRFADTVQIHEVRTPLGARRQLTFDREPIYDAEYLSSDPLSLLLMRDEGGNEDYQIYRWQQGAFTLLTDGKSRHEGLRVERGRKRFAFANNARNGRDMDLYVADAQTGQAKRVYEANGTFSPLDFSPDGKFLLAREYLSISRSRLHLIDLVHGGARQLTPDDVEAAYRSAFFDRTGKRIYVTSDRGGEMVELYELALEGPKAGEFTSLTHDIPWNVEQATLSPDGSRLAFTVNEEGYSALYLLDTRTRRHRRLPRVPAGILSGLRYAERADVLGFTVLSPTSMADAFVYDVRRERAERFTESELGGLDPSSFVTPTLVRFESFDGLSVPAFVYRPRGEGPFPVVIDIHGGPEAQARPYFRGLSQYLAVEKGIATVVPNVRGSDGYGKTYLSLDDGRKREDSVRDIGALLDFIARDPGLDEARVAVMGGSYGGYMTLASLVHYPTRLRGGVDVVGIANFVSFLESTRDYRRHLRRAEYGDESDPEMRAFLTSISPLTNVARIDGALLVAHGRNDPRVPVGEAMQIVEAVRARGREVWSVIADNEGHGFQKKENRDRLTEITAYFLERLLAPRGD